MSKSDKSALERIGGFIAFTLISCVVMIATGLAQHLDEMDDQIAAGQLNECGHYSNNGCEAPK